MLKGFAAAASAAVVALAVAVPALGVRTMRNVQHVQITFLAGDRVLEGNLAIAPGLPVTVTVTNYTREFHTFTVPELGVSELIRPAHGSAPSRTTFAFTSLRWGTFAWHCTICPSGMHGRAHEMGGTVYAIVNPTAVP